MTDFHDPNEVDFEDKNYPHDRAHDGASGGAQAGTEGIFDREDALSGPVGRHRLPNRRAHELVDFECGGFRFTGGIGHFDDGRLAEVFLTSSKTGTAIDTAARDSAVVASVALQHGADVETLRRALMRNSEGMASGPLGALLDLLADGGP